MESGPTEVTVSDYKGTGIDYVRRLVAKTGVDEAALTDRLSPAEAGVYRDALALSWVDCHVAERILRAAAELVYPDHPRPLFELSRRMAQDNLGGIYKLMLRVASVPTVIERGAKLWSTYHAHGTAEVEKATGRNEGALVVKGYPHFAPGLMESVAGYIYGTLELTGSKGIQVEPQQGAAGTWRWNVRWS
jgi:hypothetical protein